MKRSVDFERVLSLVDKIISPTYLNPTQEIVLREVWNGKTYTKMAYDYNYDPEYIKTVGCNLWHILSQAFDEQINKSNFVPFMRRKISSLIDEMEGDNSEGLASNQDLNPSKEQICNWTTAPDTKNFFGRDEEIKKLHSFSKNPDCRLAVVSGMTGSGKTTLVTEFAKSIKEQFDCVIWFSLSQRPSLTELLNKYLSIIAPDQISGSNPKELSFLLSELINCLREQRVLLVLDGLQCILEVDNNGISYKQGFEGYGQFLRSIISTNHQSLLVATSRIKPKLLEYYASDQVSFLDLQGFDKKATISFLGDNIENSLIKKELLQLSRTLQYNPQLLKIANNHLEMLSEDDAEQVVKDLSLLEEIGNLFEQELSYLLPLEREIVYWLAISCEELSSSDLSRHVEHSQSKLKFTYGLKSLIDRSLVIKENNGYALMPIMKLYLRRKLVKQAI